MDPQFIPQPPSDADLSAPVRNTAVPPAPQPRPPVTPQAAPGGYRPAGPRPPVYPGPGVPYPGPAPRPNPAPAPEPPRKGPGIGTRIILRCIAVLLSIVLFSTLLVGIVIYDGKELLNPDNLYTLLDQLESEDYEDNELLLAVQNEMVYWVNELFTHEYGSYYHLERDDIVDFLEESTVNQFLAEKAAGYVRDILEDTRKTKVTTRELKKLYKENRDLMEEELGINISPEIDDQILENLEKIDVNAMIEENLFDYLDSENSIDRDLRNALELVSTVFSDSSFLICIIVAAILAIALVLCNRLRPAGSLMHIGLPMVLAGGIMVIPVLMAGPLFEGIFDAMDMEMTRDAERALTLLADRCGSILTPAPLTILIIGGVFLLLAPVMKLIFKKK